MSKELGYISLYRSLIKSDLWLAEKFTRGQAWVDLLMLANYREGFIRVRGNKITIKRGQCGWSQLKLCERWMWSRGKVKRFLNELENDKQIIQQKNTVTSLITIVNYEKYQTNGTTDSTASDTTDGQQTVQQTDSRQDTNNKNNNNNKKNNTTVEENKFSNDDVILSEFIFSKILLINKNNKKPDFNKWAEVIRLMRERDGRTHKQIQDLFLWANSDDFWSTNILSPKKLRAQWDQLTIKKNKSTTQQAADNTPHVQMLN